MNAAGSRQHEGIARRAGERGPSGRAWALPIGLAIVGLTAFLHYLRQEPPPVPPAGDAIPVRESPAPPERHTSVSAPAPAVTKARTAPAQEPTEPPLPALDASDTALKRALAGRLGSAVAAFVRPEHIVRRLVVTIDNLPRAKAALEQRPVKPTPGELVTAGSDDAPTLAAANYARYEPFVAAVAAVDADTVVGLYRRYYPLFQQAYEELGYPQGDFNARLVAVIDDLLAAPEVHGPIRLVRPKVLYEFADKTLEARSAGQKLLIRMGPRNAAIVKGKLREIRERIARGASPGGPRA
jgi:hypothetical protein